MNIIIKPNVLAMAITSVKKRREFLPSAGTILQDRTPKPTGPISATLSIQEFMLSVWDVQGHIPHHCVPIARMTDDEINSSNDEKIIIVNPLT